MIGYFDAHSPRWNYTNYNAAGKEVEDLLNSTSVELIFNASDSPTYLHYNGKQTNTDLLLVSSDISDHTTRTIIDTLGDGRKPMIATICYNYQKNPESNNLKFHGILRRPIGKSTRRYLK